MQFNLTLEQVNIILTALGELPAKLSYELITEVRNQAAMQLNQGAENGKETSTNSNKED